MRAQTRERLASEAATWRHLGLIDDALAEELAARYRTRDAGGSILLRWLGFFGAYMLATAVIGLLTTLAALWSLLLSTLLLAAAGLALWAWGARLALDRHDRFSIIGSALITLGLICGFAALSLLYLATGGSDYRMAYPTILLITAAAALLTAYRFHLRWPLAWGLLLLFHGMGSYTGYQGSGTYFLALHDPWLMSYIAAAAAAFGVWHERVVERRLSGRHTGFGAVYIVFGLLYCNCSLWLLSLWPGGLSWALAFAAASIAQIVAGGFLKDPRFTGFGAVFLGIGFYTRLFEHFWDRLSAGACFLFAGLSALALGALLEGLARRRTA